MTRPLLIRDARERTPHPVLAGGYDEHARLWMIESPDGPKPAAATGTDALEILTKTRVRQESDDEEFSLLAIVTKTDIQQEADDQIDQTGVGMV